MLAGNQQARAVAAVVTAEGVYFASDTPLEANHVYRLSRDGTLATLADLDSSCIEGCLVGDTVVFSTMVEPSAANPSRLVSLYAGREQVSWRRIASWKKDAWPMRFFQYGNAFLPAGENLTEYLAVTTIAVRDDDLVTTIFRMHAQQVESERRAIFASSPKLAAHVPFMKRIRYLQRVFSAYLLPGKSQLTFWHETPRANARAALDQIGEYYMEFASKADYAGHYDASGIPMLDYRGHIGLQYNPIAIAQYGLGNYNLFVQGNSEERRRKFSPPPIG